MVLRSLLNLPMKSNNGAGGRGTVLGIDGGTTNASINHILSAHATPNPPKKWSGVTAPIVIWLHGFVSIKGEP